MSYSVKITNQADSGDGISVEARVNGEPVAHTFPKGMGFFEEPDEGKPRFVEKLEQKYEDKMKRQGKVAQSALTEEEKKVRSGKFLNKTYGDNENFKEGNNRKDIMENIDFSEPEQIRRYLKENMAEGYLSEEEGLNIDEFVDEYETLMEMRDNFGEIIRKVFEDKVK